MKLKFFGCKIFKSVEPCNHSWTYFHHKLGYKAKCKMCGFYRIIKE